MDFSSILLIVAAAVFLFLLIKLLTAPLRWAVKILLHALLGFVLLFLVNLLGSFFGVSLEINWLNALVSGILGVPGILILLLIKLLL